MLHCTITPLFHCIFAPLGNRLLASLKVSSAYDIEAMRAIDNGGAQ
jgi:hypothetical protein